jgi:hypothetical protein
MPTENVPEFTGRLANMGARSRTNSNKATYEVHPMYIEDIEVGGHRQPEIRDITLADGSTELQNAKD